MEYDIMETFAAPKKVVVSPHFPEQRKKCLATLSDEMIDPPILDIIHGFNQLPFCFTLQACYGHFLYDGQRDPLNLNPLPVLETMARVEYRIAYIAFCIENSVSGKSFLKRLEEITLIDPQNIQLCSAEWFWERQVNSYALQVEPDRFKEKDSTILNYQEASAIEKIRAAFFVRLKELL
jgi:hypothetical protein